MVKEYNNQGAKKPFCCGVDLIHPSFFLVFTNVFLGLGWSYPCDVWSCGCIIFELFTGDAMFRVRLMQKGLKQHALSENINI